MVGCYGLGGQAIGDQEIRGGLMSENIRETLGREASEAEAHAEAEERGEVAPTRGQRGRKRAADPSQVYAVRIPVSKLRRLRELAEELGTAPSALIRQWVIERLEESATQDKRTAPEGNVQPLSSAGRTDLRLGPSRRRSSVKMAEPRGKQERRRA
jgi:hypothetical protein